MYYSGQSQALLRSAASNARSLGHSYVGSVHLLLALLQQQGLPAYLLGGCGLREDVTRDMAVILCGRGEKDLPLHQGFTKQARMILRGAAQEAQHLKLTQVEPIHILLSVLRKESTVAADILRIYGVDREDLFHRAAEHVLPKILSKEKPKKEAVYLRLLEQFSEDLIQKAAAMEPVIGRDREIDAVMGILSRKNKNNPALIGEPGVGKTAIAEGLAQRMAAGNVPPQLKDKRL